MRETDEYLLAAIKRELPAGKQDAFETLLLRYEKLIYHVAFRYFNNAEDASDLSQEAVLKIYKGLPRVHLAEGGTLKSWICAVTVNVCLDELRRRKPETLPLPEEAPAAAPSAEDAVLHRERAAEITAAVAKLPPDWRTLIILRELIGLSYQELAEATGVGVNTVKSRLSRARTALRKLLLPDDG